jgi:putative membrane protein
MTAINRGNLALLLPLAAIFVLNFSTLWGLNGGIQAVIIVIAAFAFAVLHGSAALGWRNLLAFLILTIVISFAAEAIGVATGLVFGAYHYTDNLGPKVLGVPPLIQLAYIAMGYASMMMARVIVGGAQRAFTLAGVLVGTLIMVGWDVAMDPYQSTVSGDWIWEKGGAYFGVPMHNYAGWFFTVLIFMFAYWLFQRQWPEPEPGAQTAAPAFQSFPAVLYGLMAMNIIVTPFVARITSIASPGNYTLPIATLESSMTLIALFVMGTPVVLALVQSRTQTVAR